MDLNSSAEVHKNVQTIYQIIGIPSHKCISHLPNSYMTLTLLASIDPRGWMNDKILAGHVASPVVNTGPLVSLTMYDICT